MSEECPETLEDIDSWSELLGYETDPSSSVEEKVQLRWEHAQAMVETNRMVCERLGRLPEFLGMVADVLGHTLEKTEGRVAQVQTHLGELLDALERPSIEEAKEIVLNVGTYLQFFDIHRQEIEALRNAVTGLGDFIGSADELEDGVDMFEMMPEALEALIPRTDIDAQDVAPEDAGPLIELF